VAALGTAELQHPLFSRCISILGQFMVLFDFDFAWTRKVDNYYVYMSSDGPPKRDSPFWRHCTVRFTCLKSFTWGRRVGKHPLCSLVNKGLHGVGKHVHWCTDFTNLAIAVHVSHDVGAVNYGLCCTL